MKHKQHAFSQEKRHENITINKKIQELQKLIKTVMTLSLNSKNPPKESDNDSVDNECSSEEKDRDKIIIREPLDVFDNEETQNQDFSSDDKGSSKLNDS